MNRRVDQKLHFAKLTLASIDTNPSSEKNPLMQTALVESALFHLHIAYRAYLHELLMQYQELLVQYKVPMSVETAQQAAVMLQAQQLQSGDIDELVKLERSGAWPAQLCAAFVDATNLETKNISASKNGIALRDVTTRVDSEVLNAWLQQFQILLQRQREHAQEW